MSLLSSYRVILNPSVPILLLALACTNQLAHDLDSDTDSHSDGTGVDAGSDNPDPGTGTWADPIVIDMLPFQFSGDTTAAPADIADVYANCAPDTDESGGEFVFRIMLEEPTLLNIQVDDVSGDDVDIDIHLLDGPTASSCIARDNRQLVLNLSAGEHWITADTWVDGTGRAMAGPFQLSVKADSGASNCGVNPISSCQDGNAPLVNGVPTEAPGQGGCAAGMVSVDTFCIDRYEAMLVKVEANGDHSPWSPYLNPANESVLAMSVAGVVPQGHISQLQAKAACTAAGKRLCSNSEWLRACQGSAGTTYPYGNSHQDDVCNEDRTCHPVIQFYETSADWIWSKMNNSCINQLPEGLSRSGDHPGCQTEDGALDMMGNLHEWTADPSGTFRGGFYVDTTINGAGCLYRTTAHNVSHSDYSTGFRCCAD